MKTPQWPSISLTRVALIVGTPIALVVATQIVAWAASLKTWNSGDTLTAADLNANFAAMGSDVASVSTALTSLDGGAVKTSGDQTISGTKTFGGDMRVNGTLHINYLLAAPNKDNGYSSAGVTCSPVLNGPGQLECVCPNNMGVLSG